MANYLMKYKDKYKLLAEYDVRTKDFPREYNGMLAEQDVYIACQKGGRIYSFGRGILEYYQGSLGRGRNILRAIKADNKDSLILHTEESDEEVLFQFRASSLEELEQYLQPRTYGAGRSPFSSKNLPKTPYKLSPDKEAEWKELISSLPQPLMAGHLNKQFEKAQCTKKYTQEMLVADMRKAGLKGRFYWDSIGMWDKYMKFMREGADKCRQ